MLWTEEKSKPYFINFFVQGWEYKLLGLIPTNLHFMGVEEGGTLYILGTDKLGRDLWGKACEAGRISLSMSLFGTIISVFVGSLLGIVSGYYGGRVDNILQRFTEFVAAFPTLPLWMVALEWLGPDRRRPTGRWLLGVLLGIVGIVVLVGPGAITGNGNVDLVGAGVLVLASLVWGIGSLFSKHADMPDSPQMNSALQMVAGGALLVPMGLATGEAGHLALGAVSTASLVGLGYLVVFGSLLAFTAFAWLLRVEPPSRVATYAYVNPMVAVLLGWAIAGEALTWSTIAAAGVIVGAVALIVSQRKAPAAGATDGTSPSADAANGRRRGVRAA